MLSSKKCPECDNAVLGRSDKKFCSDACRNSMHNRLKQEDIHAVRNVNQILIRNRKILFDVMDSRGQEVSLNYLRAKGFNFNFYTHQQEEPSGRSVIFCYDIGYRREASNLLALLKDDKSLVVRK